MKAEIIAVGTELTSGAKLDTNSQWLSQQLSDVGLPVHFHTTVADNHDEQLAVLRTAVARSDVVLMTGGLGPTQDDLARQVIAEVAGTPLELDPQSLEIIRNMFERRGRTMPDTNRIQAMFPRGSSPLPNPIGTAPGIWVELPRAEGAAHCRIAALPGVPSEMHRMFREQVLPRLPHSGLVIRRALIHCFGLGESHTEELLGEITSRGRDPEVGITAHEATITLRIEARGGSEQECQQKLDLTSLEIRQRLGHFVFGVGDDVLETVVLRMLAQAGLTLATVEIATLGRLSERLAIAAGSTTAYAGGLVLPDNGVPPRLPGERATPPGAPATAPPDVHLREAEQLAEECRRLFGSDLALAVGPAQRVEGQLQEPATCVALAGPDGVRAEAVYSVGNPHLFVARTASVALDLARLALGENLRTDAG